MYSRILNSEQNSSQKETSQVQLVARRQVLTRHHPILPLAYCELNKGCMPLLNSFVEEKIQMDAAGDQVEVFPTTITDFFYDYFYFLTTPKLETLSGRYSVNKLVDGLAKIAFRHFICMDKLTPMLLWRELLPSGIISSKEVGEKERKWAFWTLGLLEETWSSSKSVTEYEFVDQNVEMFLAAQHQANLLMKMDPRKYEGKSAKKLFKSLKAGSSLPGSGDVWRMTFGLLSRSNASLPLLQKLMEHLIIKCRSTKMAPREITMLLVECLYESQNPLLAGSIADPATGEQLQPFLDLCTHNQTIRYTRGELCGSLAPRSNYSIHAAGYLIRSCSSVYGLQLSDVDLTASQTCLLTSPVNDVNDSSIQFLDLSYNPLGAKSMRNLRGFIVKASQLTHLDFTGCQLAHGFRVLAEFAFPCTPLLSLKVGFNEINDETLEQSMPHFRYAVTLEHLDLAHNCLTSRSVTTFAEKALPQLRGLRYLDFTGNNLDVLCVLAIDRASNIIDQCAREEGTFCWKTPHHCYLKHGSCSHLTRFWSNTGSYRCLAEEKKCGTCSQHHCQLSVDTTAGQSKTLSPQRSVHNDSSFQMADECKFIHVCTGSPNLSPARDCCLSPVENHRKSPSEARHLSHNKARHLPA